MCLSGRAALPADPGTPCSTLPIPILTSTPVCPPPPPPPPLPPPALAICTEGSVSEVIRQRRATKREKLAQCDPSPGTAPAALPSMLEVLRDLNQVKLRSVERYESNGFKFEARLSLKLTTERGFVFVDLQVELQ